MTTVLSLLLLQACLGALDNFWHHEFTERLPQKRTARLELALHSAREFLYGCLFLGLAHYQWHGAWAALIAGLLLAEAGITLADFIVEDRSRRLPAFERVLHTILALLFGICIAALAPILTSWYALPTTLEAIDYGWFSILFSAIAVGVWLFALRNAKASLEHYAPPRWVRAPLLIGARPSGRVVLISGGSGFIGRHLVRHLLASGDRVWVWSRDAERALEQFGPQVRIVTDLSIIETNTSIDAIVHLAGAPVFGLPWTRARRQLLLASRSETAQALIELAARLIQTPRVWIGASAIGYYGPRGDCWLSEAAPPQECFQSQLCEQVEDIMGIARSLGMRVVTLRIGLVLGRGGGILQPFSIAARLGLAAVIGTGKQWLSWIHIDDLVRIVAWALERPELRGPINAVAPAPIQQAQFQACLAGIVNRPRWLRLPTAPLRLLLGEMSELLVDGQRVAASRLLAERFQFHFATLPGALRDLLAPTAVSPPLHSTTEACEVYFNGDCPVCSATMAHYRKSVETRGSAAIQFVDSTQAAGEFARYGLRREHLEQRLYLRDERGALYSGFDALLQLWCRLPRHRWLARALARAPIRYCGEFVYDHIVAPLLAKLARLRAQQRSNQRKTA